MKHEINVSTIGNNLRHKNSPLKHFLIHRPPGRQKQRICTHEIRSIIDTPLLYTATFRVWTEVPGALNRIEAANTTKHIMGHDQTTKSNKADRTY
jgi:hypothetical protein